MDRQRYLIPILALITMWRLALLPTMELSPDEGLALFYGRHLQLWYLEMGPLVPWLVKLSTSLLGVGELGVRFGAPILALVASVCLWRLCRGVFDANTASWSVVVLQMVPGFNVAAISMTSSIVGLTCLLAFLLSLRQALHRAAPWDRMWVIASLCLLLAILADWRNALAYFCALAALGGSQRRRHHVLSPGFMMVTFAVLLGLGLFVRWNIGLDWPSWEAGELEPVWQLWPNVLRWLLLASPLLVFFIAAALRRRFSDWKNLGHDDVLILAFALPFALLDLGWGPRERWPDTGFLLWLVLAIALTMHHSVALMTMRVQQKVVLRSVTLFLAALQSMILMRTDMLRRMHIRWPLLTQVTSERSWRTFLWADPSSGMMGWRQGADLVNQVLSASAKPNEPAWFVISRHWPLAVMLDAYLPPAAPLLRPTADHPRIHVVEQPEREHPLSLLPRYDAMSAGEGEAGMDGGFRGRHALYVTDQAHSATPPSAIRRSFDHWDTLSVVRIMHAGQEVRTLKIFACYGYKPPDL